MRRWCRGASDHAVVRNASTKVSASSTVCIRPPIPISLRVVVLTGQRRRLDAPRQRAAGAGHLVRRDLLTVARAADHDAEAFGIGDGPLGGGDAERRVVVLGVVGVGTAVDGLVAAGLQVLDDRLLEFVSGVVGAEVDAHGGHITVSPSALDPFPCPHRVATKPSSNRSSIRCACSVEPLARKIPIRLVTTSSARTSDRTVPSELPALKRVSTAPDDAVPGVTGFDGARGEHRTQRLGHPALGRDERRVAVHPATQRDEGRVALQQLARGRGHLGELGLVDGFHERFTGGEVPVQRADADTGVARDGLERHGGAVGGGEGGGRRRE